MACQRFCLRWNNHQSNLLSVFDQLLHAETFTDVTLAVDGQYLKAHKMVLSACSPYFNALFVNHPEKHPIVILKDVPYSDMKSLLDFMYRGEVSVDQARLTAFLRVAESLRIKGLTEVNDDKPSEQSPTPPPPQLHRIQPYLVQQRNKAQSMLNNNNNNNGSNSSLQEQSQQHHHQQQQQQPQHQQQSSLLSSALSSMPKRKRGRPRKLSGSSNGTGNDYDEYERETTMQDSHSEMLDGKTGTDGGYSGNDDGSDDNQRESCDNDHDMNESRDSSTQSKKHKLQSKEDRQQHHQQQQQQQQQLSNNDNDNSTSVHLVNSSPELSQRLFGISKPNKALQSAPVPTPSSTSAPLSQQSKQPEILDPATHLPTALGLKIRVHPQQHQQQQNSSNSILQQQLRSTDNVSGSKSTIIIEQSTGNNTTCKNQTNNMLDSNDSCTALHSLANAAERQQQSATVAACGGASGIKPPSANNLHHQYLMHMASNPIIKTNTDYFNKQQHQQHDDLHFSTTTTTAECFVEGGNEKSDSMGATDGAAIDDESKSSPDDVNLLTPMSLISGNNNRSLLSPTNNNNSNNNNTNKNSSATRPVQRRRIRRKAQSTIDDQAEHLTEMSVRGLDLFRYASITEGVYQCTECAKENVQKTFKNKYSFQRHAFLYHEGKHRKVFPCPVCSKEFSRPDKMKNHMKMTHECFVPKDVAGGYHPLNYLITAAAAGDLQQLFPQIDNNGGGVSVCNDDDAVATGVSLVSLSVSHQATTPPTPPPLIKFKNDILIKSEIDIPNDSPSPSPPPQPTQRLKNTLIASE